MRYSKWEYTFSSWGDEKDDVHEKNPYKQMFKLVTQLNQLGSRGWELVNADVDMLKPHGFFLLKRSAKVECVFGESAAKGQMPFGGLEDISCVSPIELDEQEAKLLSFMINKIHPDDKDIMTAKIDIEELCKIFGTDIMNTLKNLFDKSACRDISKDGVSGKQLVRWIDTYVMIDGLNEIEVVFSRSMRSFIMDTVIRNHCE